MYINDLGLSIIMTSLPFGKEKRFVNKGMHSIYKNYRKRLSEVTNFDIERVYKEKAYVLFGTYDVAFISLIDDLEFPTRSVLPSTMGDSNDSNSHNYDFNILTGIYSSENPNELSEYCDKTFLKDNTVDELYPFVGITRLKINSLLLIGNGESLISEVSGAIKDLLKEYSKESLTGIVLSTFGFSELTLLVFAKKMDAMTDLIVKIRQLKICEVNNSIEIINNSLLKKHCKSIPNSKCTIRVDDSGCSCENHLFSKTITVFGYDFNIFEDPDNYSEYLQEKMTFNTSISFRPGHTSNFIENIGKKVKNGYNVKNDILNDLKNKFSIGKNDIILNFDDSLADFVKFIKHITKKSNLDIINLSSTIIFDIDPNKRHTFNKDKHLNCLSLNNIKISKNLEKSAMDMSNVRKNLRALGISIIISQQINSVLSLYNKSISDNLLFPFFLELNGFIDSIISTINYYTINIKQHKIKFSILEVENRLTVFINAFEIAYKNRFLQSLPTMELSDINLTYKGGVQQILSGYDAVFKAYCGLYSVKNEYCEIAYITGSSTTQSFDKGISLNYFHLFQPSVFLCIAGHEAGNILLNRMETETSIDYYSSFLEPVSNVENNSALKYDHQVFLEHLNFLELNNNNVIELSFYDFVAEYDSFDKPVFEDGTTNKISKGLDYKGLFSYIIVDLFSYRYTYLEDFDLFVFWHWTFFLQQPGVFLNYQRINPSDYATQYLRVEVLKRLLKIEGVETVHYTFKSDPLFSNLETLNKHLNSIAEIIIDDSKVHDALNYFKGVVDNLQDDVVFTNCIEMIQSLKNGESILFQAKSFNGNNKYYSYISQVVYSYLSYFYNDICDEIRNNDSKSPILSRSLMDGDVFDLANTTDLSIDQRGGWFVKGIKKRNEYFRVRMTLLRSFWHLSQIMKIDYFNS